MSVGVMDRVWKTADVDGTELLVLLALADWSNDAGESFPSYGALGKKVRRSRRTAVRVVGDLESAGHLSITHRINENGNRSNVITLIRYATTGDISDSRNVEYPSGDGVTHDTPLVSPVTPPSVTRDTPPSVTRDTHIRYNDTLEKKEDISATKAAPTFSDELEAEIQRVTGMPTRRESGGRYAWAGRMIGILGQNTESNPEAAKAAMLAWWNQRSKYSPKGENKWPADLAEFFRGYDGNGPDGNAVMDF